jgi:hypothetical protein
LTSFSKQQIAVGGAARHWRQRCLKELREIDFGAGVAHDQLWLQRSGNELQIDLLGTNQDLTVSGWYAGNARAQVQSIDAGDGLKLDSQLQQLVTAMATYSANNAGFNPTQVAQMPTDQTLQTAIAGAWHA